MCSERNNDLTVAMEWQPEEEGDRDDQRSPREGQWKWTADRRGCPAGQKLGARY